MKYVELKINVTREIFELAQAALLEHGFDSMQIEDPLDALDIAEHQELYKYDYINEEIVQKADEAVKLRKTEDAGAAASGSGRDDVVITLFFTDAEEGRRQLSDAEEIISALNSSILDPRSGSSAGSTHDLPDGSVPDPGNKPRNDSVIVFRSDSTQTGTQPPIRFKTTLTCDDSEWLYKWQEHFKPAKVGERIVVKPGWEDYEPAEGELVIEMDPGMAFGSGLHETTSMCVKALEKDLGGAYDPARYPIKVLDVGTGTGILAMAAVLLGADEALGIDIDDEAVRVAAENVKKNGLEGRVTIMPGNLMEGVSYDPDIIVANLMADLVIMLSSAAAVQLRPGGIYITSGILDVKEKTVAEAVRAAGFTIKEIMADGEWRAIVAVRNQQ